MSEYKFHVLGCRGSHPVSGSQFLRFGGATSCYILRAEKHALVLDCGTGLYDAAPYLAGCAEIDVLLTHLHYDHILGLLDSSAIPSDARVRVYISGTYASNIQKLMDFLRAPFWPISKHIGEITFVDCGQVIRLTERVSAKFFSANHPNDATIIRVDTDNGSVCLVCDWEHDSTSSDADFAVVALRDTILAREETKAEGCVFSYDEDRKLSYDCGLSHAALTLKEALRGCALMLYDGMYTEEEYPSRKGWGHSTWQEGVKAATQNHVSKLIITHHLPERTDEELLALEAQAQEVFPDIHFARAGDVYAL